MILPILVKMSASFRVPKYNSRDHVVMVCSMLPLAVLLNYLIFGAALFSDLPNLLLTVLISFVYVSLAFISYGWVAIQLRNRLSSDEQMYKRIAICLGVFYVMSAAYISVFLSFYDALGFFNYQFRDAHFINTYLCTIGINSFLTFLMEGIYRFEKLKEATIKTEQLKKEYLQSKLLGLKSQMNPHFLFNSLNTLSGLIQDDTEKAEEFLNQMSKVYRYLLKHQEERLVPLQSELAFLRSYYYLLKQRHNKGIELNIAVPDEALGLFIPPLTLQMLTEQAVSENSLSSAAPLQIHIEYHAEKLIIRNSLNKKVNEVHANRVPENISRKYRLLFDADTETVFNSNERVITLPLFQNKEVLV